MNYTIDNHTKRDKILDEKGNPIIVKDKGGKPVAQVKETKGFIVRADDAFVCFVETKKEAIDRIEKEQNNPSVLPGQVLSIENHTKREKQFDKDEKPMLDEYGKIKIKVTQGYNLRAGDKVVMFSENRADLIAKIQQVTGIENPVAAEESVKPKKQDKKRERRV